MMFPHKYFMLYAASKTHNVWIEEEICILSLLKTANYKWMEKDVSHHVV